MNPSCFGWASVYNAKSEECKSCPVRLNCVEACKEMLREINRAGDGKVYVPGEMVPVTQFGLPEPRYVQSYWTKEQKDKLAALPKKVAEKYKGLVTKRLDVTASQEIQRGVNPFKNVGGAYLKLACDHLMAGGVSRKELRESFESEFAWSEGTAASHVSVCMALLPALNIARIEGKRLVLCQPMTVTMKLTAQHQQGKQ